MSQPTPSRTAAPNNALGSTVVHERAAVPSAHFDRGTQIPGYVLVEPLGRGAYGQVWQAVRVGSGQDVAVKIFTAPAQLDWRYLMREVDRLQRVAEHPHIVTLIDANLQHDPPYYAMTLLRRGSLADWSRGGGGPLDSAQATRWFEQMAAALEFAHGKGLLHCDLKPANVLLDEEGNVRLVDFGQSRVRGEAEVALGTLAYMAPEQAVISSEHASLSEPAVGWDVYGLGATLYALLTGRAPHADGKLDLTLTHIESLAQRMEEYRRHVWHTPLEPIRVLNPGIDQDLAAIVEHCLEPDPGQRYRRVEEVAADLRRRQAHRPLSCRPRRLTYVLGKFAHRHAGMVVIAGVALLALATVFATLSIRFRVERLQLNAKITELDAKLIDAKRQAQSKEQELEVLRQELEALRGQWMDGEPARTPDDSGS